MKETSLTIFLKDTLPVTPLPPNFYHLSSAMLGSKPLLYRSLGDRLE